MTAGSSSPAVPEPPPEVREAGRQDEDEDGRESAEPSDLPGALDVDVEDHVRRRPRPAISLLDVP